ncbi:MAG: ABC transporter permease, partial [Planctomycetaceae bacterium]|nr:ABC transporter permease [Planctomycetaceae bacterium]
MDHPRPGAAVLRRLPAPRHRPLPRPLRERVQGRDEGRRLRRGPRGRRDRGREVLPELRIAPDRPPAPGRTPARTRTRHVPGSLGPLLIALALSATATLGLVLALGIFPAEPRYLVPVGGMVIGNAMT